MVDQEFEKVYCLTTGCNMHDFKINAGGVCAYVDYMWIQEQKLKILSRVPEVKSNEMGFRPISEVIENVAEPKRYQKPDNTPNYGGGGVPL